MRVVPPVLADFGLDLGSDWDAAPPLPFSKSDFVDRDLELDLDV